MFKNLKTPHGANPLSHARNLWLYFAGAALVTMLLGCGATASSVLANIGASLVVGTVCILAGVGTTAFVRRAFNLVQTGRVVQYAGFVFASWLGFIAAGSVFGGVSVSNAPAAGVLTFALAFGAATVMGEIPWRGRSWLPRKKRA
jgi:hypothetical protein